MNIRNIIIMGCSILLQMGASCAPGRFPAAAVEPLNPLDRIAEDYVKLVLAVGEHDPGYVDAYYGPEEWRTDIASNPPPLDELVTEADTLLVRLKRHPLPDNSSPVALRQAYLNAQTSAVRTRIAMLLGAKMTFDEESQALYNATAPHYSREHFAGIIQQLDTLLPGDGSISTRVNDFKIQFNIPKDRVDTVFTTAIHEARLRTSRAIELPPDEDFRIEYVSDQPWSAYNWYQGNDQSLIQINTDLPIAISRAVDLASHEGYPGHHVYNLLLENNLVKQRGWVEFTIEPLYSP